MVLSWFSLGFTVADDANAATSGGLWLLKQEISKRPFDISQLKSVKCKGDVWEWEKCLCAQVENHGDAVVWTVGMSDTIIVNAIGNCFLLNWFEDMGVAVWAGSISSDWKISLFLFLSHRVSRNSAQPCRRNGIWCPQLKDEEDEHHVFSLSDRLLYTNTPCNHSFSGTDRRTLKRLKCLLWRLAFSFHLLVAVPQEDGGMWQPWHLLSGEAQGRGHLPDREWLLTPDTISSCSQKPSSGWLANTNHPLKSDTTEAADT